MATCYIKVGEKELICNRCRTPQYIRGSYRCKIENREMIKKECGVRRLHVDFVDKEIIDKIDN